MFVGDRPEVEEIERKLYEVLKAVRSQDNYSDILEALINRLTFEISLSCPQCRKNLAKQLRKRVPQMLEDANCIAASSGAVQKPCSVH